MKIDKLISKRFTELVEKVDRIPQKNGIHVGKFTEWATSVLSLFQYVFGDNNV